MIETLAKISLGFGLAWYAVLRGAKGLIIRVSSYSFRSIDLVNGTVSLNLNLLIKNPLLFGLTIKNITGDIYIQGNKAGYVNTTYNYFIAGGKTHILPVIVNLQMGGLLQSALLNIQSGDIRTLTVAFDGRLYVSKSNVGIPLQFELNYNDFAA